MSLVYTCIYQVCVRVGSVLRSPDTIERLQLFIFFFFLGLSYMGTRGWYARKWLMVLVVAVLVARSLVATREKTRHRFNQTYPSSRLPSDSL